MSSVVPLHGPAYSVESPFLSFGPFVVRCTFVSSCLVVCESPTFGSLVGSVSVSTSVSPHSSGASYTFSPTPSVLSVSPSSGSTVCGDVLVVESSFLDSSVDVYGCSVGSVGPVVGRSSGLSTVE